MASQEVLTALKTLHREIEKLEPAIEHVSMAQQVTQTVKAIPQKHLELLQEVKSNDARHKNDLKNVFVAELSNIREEYKKLQKGTSDLQEKYSEYLKELKVGYVNQLNELKLLFSREISELSKENKKIQKVTEDVLDKHKSLLKDLKIVDLQHKDELKILFERELLHISQENKKLQNATSEIQHQVKLELEALAKLKETVQSFHERVEKINFPERLDKLDANVAGIMAAIQSVQSRLDGLERNISDRLRDMQDYQKETRAALQSGLEHTKTALQTAVDTAAKKQQTLTYITWALVVVAIIITFVLKK